MPQKKKNSKMKKMMMDKAQNISHDYLKSILLIYELF